MGKFSGLKNIKYRLRFLFRNINSNLAHDLNRERIQRAGLQPGAVCFEIIRTNLIKKTLRHLATGTVVDADEQHLFSHMFAFSCLEILFHAGLKSNTRFLARSGIRPPKTTRQRSVPQHKSKVPKNVRIPLLARTNELGSSTRRRSDPRTKLQGQ